MLCRKLSLARSLLDEMVDAKHPVHASLRRKVDDAVSSFVGDEESY
jgi:hypothetical protein